ncbi:PAS domain-containing protein [Paenibacillus agricola]|uniref:PAS domain S-box protein n=1 Tax=Paenibacillus agricola TaxID=2716264 RepID=A0ABX0JG90_9BACL|nr:PAS domain-containing protein [Paenibacillus agricola]NHN35587.1 PAS domain S-box protein [Paenibacillus agricola]
MSINLPKYTTRKDEIGRLAFAIQKMTVNLRELFDNLESQNEEIIAQNTEIREQQQTTEHLLKEKDQLYALSFDLIVVSTLDGTFRDINPAWETTLGYSKEEMLAHPLTSLVHPKDMEETVDKFTKLRVLCGKQTPNRPENC